MCAAETVASARSTEDRTLSLFSLFPGGGAVALESGIDAEARRGLTKRGHDVRTDSGGFGGYQAIMYDAERDVYIGASESRKDGHAAGH